MSDTVIEGEVVEPAPAPKRRRAKPKTNGAALAVPEEKWTEPDTKWPHQWIEFEGDRLAVRKPTLQALAAYSLSASRFVDPQIQNDISGLFIARHMSPETYAHVMDRFLSPDDPDYTEESVGAIMRMVVELTTDAMPAEPNRAARRKSSSQS